MTQDYYGTNRVTATKMTRLEYTQYRGWAIPSNESPEDEGYLVEYLDGGLPNHPYHTGYITWSPKTQFEAAYQPVNALSFSHAIGALKSGLKVARAGWNGKGMWLMLVPEVLAEAISFQYAALKPAPWIGMKTADEKFVPWLASQTDMLSDDWQIIE